MPIDSKAWAGLSALSDPVRLRIVLLLREREQCVCHLTAALGLTQGTISHHMTVLRNAGLVRDRRDPADSRWVYYRLDPQGAGALRALVWDLLDSEKTDQRPVERCDDDC